MDNDTISRQAAIDALARTAREKFNLSDEYNQYLAGLMDAQLEIKYLPSAEQRGRWELNIDDKGWSWDKPYMCDQCGKWNGIETPYCPHCGAKMDEVGE